MIAKVIVKMSALPAFAANDLLAKEQTFIVF